MPGSQKLQNVDNVVIMEGIALRALHVIASITHFLKTSRFLFESIGSAKLVKEDHSVRA